MFCVYLYMQNNSISFKGISHQDLKTFLPNLSDRAINKITIALEKELPNDILCISTKPTEKIIHFKKTPLKVLQANEFEYKGSNDDVEKFTFLTRLIYKIKKGANSTQIIR